MADVGTHFPISTIWLHGNPYILGGSESGTAMDYTPLCKALSDLHPRIVGAWVIGQQTVISSWVKPGFREPDKETQRTMSLQAQIVVSIAEGNTKTYGKFRYILVSYEPFDCFLFPLDNHEVVSIGCIRPYSVDDVVFASEKILKAHDTT